MVLALMGIISGVIATAFSVSVRASDRIEAVLPPARDANSLNFWLASDISSAIPVDPNWLVGSATAIGTGCLASAADAATNVLRIETRNPILPTSPETYIASYRYMASTKELWRVFCRTGLAPSSVSVIAGDIDPAVPPLGTIDPTLTAGFTKRWAKISFGVSYRNVTSKVAATAAVRVPEVQPPVGPGIVGGGPARPNCAYIATVFSPSPVSQAAAPAGNNRPLATDVQVTLTTNESAGAVCESILVPPVPGTGLIAVATTNGNLECLLVKSGPSMWSATTCPVWKVGPWKVPGPAGSIANFPITFVNRTDPSDVTTDLILLGTGSPILRVLQGP
jgi:hypothetical protein